jgi:Fe-S cluster assembly protein SufD
LELEKGKTQKIEYEEIEGIEIIQFEGVGDGAVEDKLNTLLPKDHLAQEHAEKLTGGLLIKVTRPVMRPLFIKHTLAESSNWHTLIIVEPGASAKIIETFEGEAKTVSHCTEAFLGENSHLTYADTQTVTGTFLTRKRARLARDASTDWFELAANTGMTYSRIASLLDGENASTTINTLYLGDSEDRIDVGAKAEHQAKHTTSDLRTRGALAGKAKAIYEGTLIIGEDAAKSDAFQRADSILLSEHAEAKASPTLHIGNNDVTCSHAATTCKPDKEKRFYLQARGLDRHEADKLLITAFLWPVVEAVPDYARRVITPIAKAIIERYAEVQP